MAHKKILIVGLGNPGKQYEKTRHNIGFHVVDAFQKKHDFSDWKMKEKFHAALSEGGIGDTKIVLAKPQTFVNNSGQSVKSLVSGFKFQVSGVWIVQDDLALPLGTIRISQGRGSAGHKGVESIVQKLGNKNFVRFRVGIKAGLRPNNIENWVLEKFTGKEEQILKYAVKKTLEAIETATKNGPEKAMNLYNKKSRG